MSASLSKEVCDERSNIFQNSSYESHEKRITPFSIDDILAKSREGKIDSFKNSDRICFTKCNFLPLCLNLSNKNSRNMFSWNQDITYAKWLESMQRLCSVPALQPFWFHDYRSQLNPNQCFQNFCRRRSHPYTEEKLYFKQEKKFDACLRNSRRELKKPTNSNDTNSEFPIHFSDAAPEKRRNNCSSEQTLQKNELKISICSDSDNECFTKSLSTEDRDSPASDSPLSALEKLTCVTFKGMEKKQHELHEVAAGREAKVKRRKCRTAFTAFQLSVLERRFTCHKYLTPTDRDQIAHILGLSAPQVITWFQNRRAKLKRDLEEMRNDIKTVKTWTQASSPAAIDVNLNERRIQEC